MPMTALLSSLVSGVVATPARARFAPFAVYMAFIVLESFLPEGAPGLHWLYGVQVVATALVLAALWPRFAELHPPGAGFGALARFGEPRHLLLATATGVVVFLAWRALDQPWLAIGTGRPLETARTLLAREPGFALTRLVGAVVLVPVMEELFWRSFVMRWTQQAEFLRLAPAATGLRAVVISAMLFGFEHHLVAAGIVAGLAYAELYRRTGNLWPVIVAHAVTNALLELGPAGARVAAT